MGGLVVLLGVLILIFFMVTAETLKSTANQMGKLLLHLPTSCVPVTPPIDHSGIYKIRANDTFRDLETTHNWAHGTLQALNPGVLPRELTIGQAINIPNASGIGDGKSGDVYLIRWGDTASGIAARFGTSVEAIVKANGLVNPE